MLIRLLLLLAATIAEAVPLALAAGVVDAWIVPNGTELLSPVSVGLAVILGFVATRVLMRRHLGERRARLMLALCALAVTVPLYLGVRLRNPMGVLRDPVVAPALAALLYTWSRGAALARENLAFDAVYASFRRGLIVLFIGLLIAVATPGTAAHRL